MKYFTLLLLSIFLAVPTLANQTYNITITRKGFEPSRIEAKVGEPITLNITRTVDTTCAKKILIPSEGIEKDLPLKKTVQITFTPKKKGEIVFSCPMKQMLNGVIIVN